MQDQLEEDPIWMQIHGGGTPTKPGGAPASGGDGGGAGGFLGSGGGEWVEMNPSPPTPHLFRTRNHRPRAHELSEPRAHGTEPVGTRAPCAWYRPVRTGYSGTLT